MERSIKSYLARPISPLSLPFPIHIPVTHPATPPVRLIVPHRYDYIPRRHRSVRPVEEDETIRYVT